MIDSKVIPLSIVTPASPQSVSLLQQTDYIILYGGSHRFGTRITLPQAAITVALFWLHCWHDDRFIGGSGKRVSTVDWGASCGGWFGGSSHWRGVSVRFGEVLSDSLHKSALVRFWRNNKEKSSVEFVGLVQECAVSMVNALEIPQLCTNPMTWEQM